MAGEMSSQIHQTSPHSHRRHHSGRCPRCTVHMHTGIPPSCRWQLEHLMGNSLHPNHLCSLCHHHRTSAQLCSCHRCNGTPSLSISSYHTVRHCCLHSHCHHRSATGCGCNTRSDTRTHLPHILVAGSPVHQNHPHSRCLHRRPTTGGCTSRCHSGSPRGSKWAACSHLRRCGPHSHCLHHTATEPGCMYIPQKH